MQHSLLVKQLRRSAKPVYTVKIIYQYFKHYNYTSINTRESNVKYYENNISEETLCSLQNVVL